MHKQKAVEQNKRQKKYTTSNNTYEFYFQSHRLIYISPIIDKKLNSQNLMV
jgi:hypothetical protein